MMTTYATPAERNAAWKEAHKAEHPGCNLFMPECEFYTDAKMIDYAFAVLESSQTYDSLFKEGSIYADSDVFIETRKHLIAGFEEMHADLKDAYTSEENLHHQYRADLMAHVLERGREYDVYDAGWRIHAGTHSVDVDQDPLGTILFNKINSAIFYLMAKGEDVTAYA